MLWSLLFIALIGRSSQACPVWETLRLNDNSSFQSSVYTEAHVSYTAGRAFDGNLSTCSHTSEESLSWWTVDLLGLYEISYITIMNKEHQNIDLTDAQILIGNSSERNFTTNAECATITTTTRNENKTFHCVNGTKWGRYVTVYKKPKGFMVLCELVINGTKKGFQLIKENKTWADALYHCREKYTDLVSILDRESQSFVELEAQKAETPFVWLGLHYSCTLDLWFWVDDHCVDFNQWSPGKPRGAECDVSGAMNTSGNYYWYTRSVYDQFNFICEV